MLFGVKALTHRLTSPEIQNYQRQFYFGKIHADFLFIYLSFYHFQ